MDEILQSQPYHKFMMVKSILAALQLLGSDLRELRFYTGIRINENIITL
jgi:hypothetical protein